jgi:ElaB/YqjD/DUF883 family membrane-anchored ribosome-binding protein
MATETPFPTSSAETTEPDTARGSPMADTGMRGMPDGDTGLRSGPMSDPGAGSAPFGDTGARSTDRSLDDAARRTAAGADDLIGRIAQTAHDTIDRLAGSAAPHVNRLQETLSGDALHQRADDMRELRDEWTESLRCTVRDNPLAAVGVAVAVGFLIARLSR